MNEEIVIEEMRHLKAELQTSKLKEQRAVAELAALKQALHLILGPEGKASITATERIAAGLLSNGGF